MPYATSTRSRRSTTHEPVTPVIDPNEPTEAAERRDHPVYRHELRPMMTRRAATMDQIFKPLGEHR
jgi:hypothetical protein